MEPGTPTGSSHLSWIAAAKAEVEDLRRRSTFAGDLNFAAQSPDSDLRRTLQDALPGYELLDKIFRGGQGVVFRAFQKGTRRDVAIKILREGPLVGPQGAARFEREVQILGQLKHPNIVTILDSGTSGGNFYYIMDFIEGYNLDDYIAANDPPPREILKLFAKICDAVNVAHLRGVIHRDLKPSNIRIDRSGQPHVMDFGLAKTDQHDEFHVVETMTGQFVGSLPWASPEQVESSPEGIDIRTDVYAIGVMMYGALTGHFPYPVEEGFRQTIEHICKTDPIRPSAESRGIDDEVDHIVLKALRKNREDRYQSAGNFARDIQRYLSGDAIEAKRDSGWYLIRKAIQKHRVTAMISSLAAMFLVSLVIVLSYYNHEVSLARDNAQRRAIEAELAGEEAKRQAQIANAVSDFLNTDLLAAVSPDEMGKDVSMRDVLDRAAESLERRPGDDLEVEGRINFTLGATYLKLGVPEKAERHLTLATDQLGEAFGEQSDLALSALNDLARAYDAVGKLQEAAAIYEKCLKIRRARFGDEHEETVTVICNMGWAYTQLGMNEKAEPLLKECLKLRLKTVGEENLQTLAAMNNLSLYYRLNGQTDKAVELAEKELEGSIRLLGDDHPDIFISYSNTAALYDDLGQPKRAEDYYRKALEGRKRHLGEAHPSTLLTTNNLASLLRRNNQADEALRLFQSAYETGSKEHGGSLPIMIAITSNLGNLYNESEQFADAEPLHINAVENARKTFPEGHEYIGIYLSRLGRCQYKLGQHEKAEQSLLEAYGILNTTVGPDSHFTKNTIQLLINLYVDTDRKQLAESWITRLPNETEHSDE